jgi:hypothetical protein
MVEHTQVIDNRLGKVGGERRGAVQRGATQRQSRKRWGPER